MKNSYEVLGLSSDASEEELKARYSELKAKYGEDRFLSGEAGNDAARKLTDLENAWSQIESDRLAKNRTEQNAQRNTQQDTQQQAQNSGFDYSYIDELIKLENYDEAQRLLDGISNRAGEWHFLQSIVFYKREWLTESRKQLVMALEFEPRNEKYRTALEKLDMVMGNPNADPNTLGNNPNMNGQMPPQNGQMCGGNCLSNCCLAYCLTDCCCSMTRCCG